MTRRLLAFSDLHVRFAANRELVAAVAPRPNDGLIVAGDVAERADELAGALELLRPKFARLYWVPGNHELWTMPGEPERGEAKYQRMVDVCRSRGVLTPEDPFDVWEGSGAPHTVMLTAGLYDYTFAPDEIAGDPERARAWALETGLRCTDEELLHPDPHADLAARCAAMCERAEARIDAARAKDDLPSVLVNHFPLLREHAVLPRIPRFSIWCGTRRTASWIERAKARVVVFGHLHIPLTLMRNGVRYEEVSVGYPTQRLAERTPDSFLREVLPGPAEALPEGWRSRRAG